MAVEEFYKIRRTSDLYFEYDTVISEKFIDNWLFENLKVKEDFILDGYTSGACMCSTGVLFFNLESAMAFKLRWG